MTAPASYALGLDFGTGSVRALLVDTTDGREAATAVVDFPGGENGVLLSPNDPNLARQNPADYLECMAKAVNAALADARRDRDFSPAQIVGIGVDTTGSTPMPVDRQNVPLALSPGFKNDLDAQAWLWKDHTAHAEAEEITRHAAQGGEPYLSKCGGTYSSEWYWSKILHCERVNPRVAAAAYAWLECCDFIPAYLVGENDPDRVLRSICAAGHKAMYHPSWDGLPSAEFLNSLQPGLARFRRVYRAPALPADRVAGQLCEAVAKKLGLPVGLPVAVGAFDAHLGAVGSGCAPGTLVKIMGTSTCDCIAAPLDKQLADIPGVCGIVPESILPGMYGIEAGQSAVGDIFNWFVQRIAPSAFSGADAHAKLSQAAAALQPGESGLVALDWHNGNRTILVDPLLTGLIVGETLATTPPEIYRALIEATAFGARRIVERIEEHGVGIDRIVACGGVAEKNPLLMQIYADVLDRPMHISRSAQACALGAAVFGAVVGGAHPSALAAQAAMTGVKEQAYAPFSVNVRTYKRLYAVYRQLHDAFGTREFRGSLHGVMKELISIRQAARSRA